MLTLQVLRLNVIILSLMAETADTRPSIYLDYIQKPPRDADSATLSYLLGLKRMITQVQPQGLTSIIEQHVTREFTGEKQALKTSRKTLMNAAVACRRYQIIHSLPPSSPGQEANNSIVAGMDEFAAFLSVVYEADIREPHTESFMQKREDDPLKYWSSIADHSRQNIGTHELRQLIRPSEEIKNPSEGDTDEEESSLFEPSSVTNYPGLAFLGRSAKDFADEAVAIAALTRSHLSSISNQGAAGQSDEVIDALRVGYDLSRLARGKNTITSPSTLVLLTGAPELGARTLLQAWKHIPQAKLTYVLSKLLILLDKAHQTSPGKVVLPKDLEFDPRTEDTLRAFLTIKEE